MVKSKTKERIDYPTSLQNIFCLLSVSGKYNVVGSANMRGILYSSDFDLTEDIRGGYDVCAGLRKLFLHKYEKAKHLPSVYFTDFKCGEDEYGEPLRWTYTSLQKNNNRGYTFEEALRSGGIVKLDCVAFMNGRFEEITEVYEISHSNVPPKKNLLSELKKSKQEYLEEGNYWKALKRQFSINSAEKKYQKNDKLIDFFNSSVGILAKSVSELDTISLVLEQTFKPPNLDEVRENLQLVKWRLSFISSQFSKLIDNICNLKSKSAIHSKIKTLRENIFHIVNVKAKQFKA